jgi:hypothetical protein
MSSVNGLGGVSNVNIQSMDIETALMMVQSQRTQLLDSQLTSQIQGVQDRNNQIASLNNVLSTLNAAQAAFPGDAKPDATIKDWNDDKVHEIEIPLNDAIQQAGLQDLGFGSSAGQTSAQNYRDGTAGTLPSGSSVMKGSTTKAQIDAAIAKVKGQIDSLGNSQQMDMLRLQSLTNKRNEAFDVMTNFVKKMQESRSSIIGNMR